MKRRLLFQNRAHSPNFMSPATPIFSPRCISCLYAEWRPPSRNPPSISGASLLTRKIHSALQSPPNQTAPSKGRTPSSASMLRKAPPWPEPTAPTNNEEIFHDFSHKIQRFKYHSQMLCQFWIISFWRASSACSLTALSSLYLAFSMISSFNSSVSITLNYQFRYVLPRG